MLAGIKFNQLGEGDILIDKNWSYKNLWGLAASKQKLIDQFKLSKDVGFSIIYDSIKPVYDSKGKLSLYGSGYNSNIWPLYDQYNHNDRISIYKKEIIENDFKFICKLEFPDRLTKDTMTEYINFFISLVRNPDFSWIENWIFFENPENIIYVPDKDEYETLVSPQDYVNFLKNVRTFAKQINPNIKIGGPCVQKALGTLMPNNPLEQDDTFYHKWLSDAIELSLLENIDFFTVQLKQQTMGLEYDYIFSLSLLLKEQLKKYSITDSIMPIYSLNQGRQELDLTNMEKLQTQSYYNVSEMLNATKNGIIPIITEIADPPNDLILNPAYEESLDGYGLFKFDLSRKPQVEVFKFILKNLKEYNSLATANELYKNNYADSITFSLVKDDITTLISVVWTKYKKENKIVILPNAEQHYLLIDGTSEKIINPFEFETTTDFLIVTQKIYTELVDYADLRSIVFKKYMHNLNSMRNLLQVTPVNYNKSIEDTNFYKILRSFSLEFADLKIEVDALKDNMYLDTVQKDSIYRNFGSMVNLEKQADWNYEKYRRLIQGVIKSLLTGPTKKSIEDAVNLFINYDSVYSDKDKLADIKIYELFKNDGIDPTAYGGIHAQFAFIVEVSKNVDIGIDQESLNRDLKYIINILKPAHTLSFFVIILTGTENYKEWYYKNHGIEFKDMDNVKFDGDMGGEKGTAEGQYGWKHFGYRGTFHTFNWQDKKNNSRLNGGALIGPRKILQDNNHTHYTQKFNELFRETNESLQLSTGYTGCPILNWRSGHITCNICPSKETCNAFSEQPKGTYEVFKKPEDNWGESDIEYQCFEEHKYNYGFIYTVNKTRLISNIPKHFDGKFPVSKNDEIKPLGMALRKKAQLEEMVMFRLLVNDDGTGTEQIIKTLECEKY